MLTIASTGRPLRCASLPPVMQDVSGIKVLVKRIKTFIFAYKHVAQKKVWKLQHVTRMGLIVNRVVA